MKTTFLLALLAACLYYYYSQDSTAPRPAAESSTAAQPAPKPANTGIVVAALPSYSERWKTGPNAQTDLKSGPNAQVDFAPFAPSEMANWNTTSGYTIVSGINLRR